MSLKKYDSDFFEEQDLKKIFLKFFSFWPYFLILLLISVITAHIYLRYANYLYSSSATIEIIDKSQDSEMALPTAMTVFNRSMINLENESGVLRSFQLHKKTIKDLDYNVSYYTLGNIKITQNHSSEWFDNYTIDFKDEIKLFQNTKTYKFSIVSGKLYIDEYNDSEDKLNSYTFNSLSTLNTKHKLPFDFEIYGNSKSSENERILKIRPVDKTAESFRNSFSIKSSGQDSDQLLLSVTNSNVKIADEYLNKLLLNFDLDGVRDRQLSYKRTMDFVDSRSDFLTKELEQIENRRQKFKQENKLFNIDSDAKAQSDQYINYDTELFKVKSQKDLISLLNDEINNDKYTLLPFDIGIEDENLNSLIKDYNLIIKQRDRLLLSAGPENIFIKNLNDDIASNFENLNLSLSNYSQSLDLQIKNLESKASELQVFYNNIPKNEKILRSIERELGVKESLFLLLLQKREEAAINYAVVKPSIKIIDYARSLNLPISPNRQLIYISSIFGSFISLIFILSLWFYFDNKVHIREDLIKLNLPILGEIPHIKSDFDSLDDITNDSRNPFIESVRMIVANLRYTFINSLKSRTILVSSSVKGEGKTRVSTMISKVLSFSDKKTILIGADLRNPQIHKLLNIERDNHKGLTELLYRNDLKWNDLIIKSGNLDILLSGTIPPNPTELLASKKFEDLINELKSYYDYIIIDSAPCLLVADTLQFSKIIDNSILILRSNHSTKDILGFISDLSSESKLNEISLVLNGVGNSSAYGYKYNYQYGYKYGYKYSYNYGYGYGYSEDKK